MSAIAMQTARSIHFSSQSNEWETPQTLFDRLHHEFAFTLDAAATRANAKCPRFFTCETDGLSQSWAGERVWCNPPYGREIGKWIEKAATSGAVLVVMLIPARTDTKAWHEYIFGKAEIRFLPGRIKFLQSGGATNPAPFPSAIIVFRKMLHSRRLL